MITLEKKARLMAIVRDLSGNSPQRDVDTHRTTTPEQTLSDIALTFDTLEDFTSLFVGIDGSGGNCVPGDTVGLILDKSHMGGMTAAAYIDSRPELGNVDLDSAVDGVVGSGGAWPTGWRTVGATGITFTLSKGDGYLDVAISGTPSTAWRIQTANAWSIDAAGWVYANLEYAVVSGTVASTFQHNLLFYAENGTYDSAAGGNITQSATRTTEELFGETPATAAHCANEFLFNSANAQNCTIRIYANSIKHIPGQHRTASADNERPVLDRLPVSGRRNLLTGTEDFSSADWTKIRGSATENVLSEDVQTGSHYVEQSFSATSGQEYTLQIEAKEKERRYVQLAYITSPNAVATFDLRDGVWTETSDTDISGFDAVATSDGYYRISVSAISTATGTSAFRLALSDTGTPGGFASYTGDGSSGVYIRKAQLELGSNLTNYQRVTNANDITETGVRSVYSLDYDGVDDGLSFDFEGGAGPADCSVFLALKTTDTQFTIIAEDGTDFVVAAGDEVNSPYSSNVGTPKAYVDGLAVDDSTRLSLRTALDDGVMHILEIRNIDLSPMASAAIGFLPGSGVFKTDGNIIGPIIVETSKLEQLPGMRQFIYNYLQTLVGKRA